MPEPESETDVVEPEQPETEDEEAPPAAAEAHEYELEPVEPGELEERPEWLLPWEIALLVSKRRSGKSTVGLALAGSFSRCQLLFLDVKCRYTLPGVDPTVGVDQLAGLEWQKQRVIHYQPSAVDSMGDRRAEEREWWGVFALCNERVDLTIVADECVPTPFGVNATPGSARRYIERKAVDRCGLIACTGRWRGTATHLRAHANHILLWPGGLADDELDDVAREIGCQRLELRAWLDQARQLGDYGFVWYDRDQQLVRLVPPLPEHVRQLALAQEITP